MRKIEEIKEEDFKIEDGVFIFKYSDKTSEFIKDKIEKELDKPFNSITKEDIIPITELVLKLNPSEVLYSVMGLLANYNLASKNEFTKVIEKILANSGLKKCRDLIMAIVDNEITEETRIPTIENFEKDNNITILISD
jgi:hypothetical protein